MLSIDPSDEFHALLAAAVDGIILIDHAGSVQAFNRAAELQFGYPAAEIIGRNVTVLMTEADALTHDGHVQRYLTTRAPHVIGKGREVTARRKNGSVFPAFLSLGVITDTEPPRFVGFVHDLTLRRATEEASRRLEERLWHVSRLATLGEMATGIAHELNQPLTAIANYAQACDRLLTHADADIGEVRGALKEITGQAVRAGDMIGRFRRLTRFRDDRREPTNVNLLIRDLTVLVQSAAQAHDVSYHLQLSEELPLVEINGPQIQHAILNLVQNAIEALVGTYDAPREVTLRTARSADGDVEISVCDTGRGIPAEIAPKLFQPFCTSKPAGTGLGLAISRTIVNANRGTLAYRPNHPAGACFILRLPPFMTTPK